VLGAEELQAAFDHVCRTEQRRVAIEHPEVVDRSLHRPSARASVLWVVGAFAQLIQPAADAALERAAPCRPGSSCRRRHGPSRAAACASRGSTRGPRLRPRFRTSMPPGWAHARHRRPAHPGWARCRCPDSRIRSRPASGQELEDRLSTGASRRPHGCVARSASTLRNRNHRTHRRGVVASVTPLRAPLGRPARRGLASCRCDALPLCVSCFAALSVVSPGALSSAIPNPWSLNPWPSLRRSRSYRSPVTLCVTGHCLR
jgi:hypothetical protein